MIREMSLMLFAALAWASPAAAQGHHPKPHPEKQDPHGHGGVVTKTKEFTFEAVIHSDQVRIYAYDAKMAPVDLEGAQGKVRVAFKDKERKKVEAALKRTDGYLSADVDLSEVEEGKAEAGVILQGLPGKKEKAARFAVPFRLARLFEYACPMKCTDPHHEPGDCPKCGMALVKGPYIYACSMHPHVTSRTAGDKCWVCGMDLVKRAEDGSAPEKKGHQGHGSGRAEIRP